RECYRTFNMGVGMVIVVNENEAGRVIEISKKNGINAQIIGKAVKGNDVVLHKGDKKISLL
ncbi:MAG: AIR synthase-related protein, partial [Candidatus Micrarchaeota archaeon]